MKNIALAFSLFITTLAVQLSFGQNLLLLHDKVNNKDCVVRINKKVKIKTNDEQIIKGKIFLIKDSSIVINKVAKTEIVFTDIHFFYCNNKTSWKTASGIVLGFFAATMTTFVIEGFSQSSQVHQNSTGTNDNPIPGLAGVGAIGLPALYAGTYYGLIHKKKYNTQLRYDLITIKNK